MITKELIDIIKDETNVDLNNKDVINCRDREFVEARAIYYTLLRHHTKMTYTKIGQSIGKNHATVMHAADSLPFWIQQDKSLGQTYERIQTRFKKILGGVEVTLDNYARLLKDYRELKLKYEGINLLD